jgi:DNA-directed RNA polymerase specialized sigma24 family protein
MNKQIEDYIVKNYFYLLQISNKITRGHELSNDLLQDVLLQLYEKNSDIVLRNYTDSDIKYYITAVMRINWNSKTSPFYYRIRRETDKYTPINDNYEVVDDMDDKMDKEILIQCLEISFAELDWFRKSVFELYMTMGSYNAVSKKTGIPLTSIARYIRESKSEIKSKIKDKLNENN